MGNLFTLTTNRTEGAIVVSAQPEYLDYESSASEQEYIWAYNIRIVNNSNRAVQVVSRYWHITDGKGLVQEVEGPGIVGEQPIILPDELFEYTSSVSLTTPTGMMHGIYKVKDHDEKIFDVQIPVFSLDSDEAIRLAN